MEDFLLFTLIEKDGVDVALEMINRYEWKALCVGERFGVGDADKQRASKTGAGGNGDGIQITKLDLSLL